MEPKFTEQQSLAIIAEMIERTKSNFQKNSANSMILWGYAIAALAIANFILSLIPGIDKPYLVWWLVIPVWLVDLLIKRRVDRSAVVRTQIDGILTYIWRGFGITVALFFTILFSIAATLGTWDYVLLINPIMMLLVGMAKFIAAKCCGYRPFYWIAIGFWTGSVLCMLSYCVLKNMELSYLILAACMIGGFAIPGHILNKQAKDHV